MDGKQKENTSLILMTKRKRFVALKILENNALEAVFQKKNFQ
jgi:hypothetical protein